MKWNQHLGLDGQHAFLGGSNYAWLNYDGDKLVEVYRALRAKEQGTKYHELAKQLIDMKQKLPDTNRTLNSYVNDAIGFGMSPEVLLYYSEFCFGTADAILFDQKTKFLRIHDLKTGKTPTKMLQLKIYAALFCLEYKVSPAELTYELRIYQNDDIYVEYPDGTEIAHICDKIVSNTKILTKIKREEG